MSERPKFFDPQKTIVAMLVFASCLASAEAGVIRPNMPWWKGHVGAIELCVAGKAELKWTRGLLRKDAEIFYSPGFLQLIQTVLDQEFNVETTGFTYMIKGECSRFKLHEVDAVLFLTRYDIEGMSAVGGNTQQLYAKDLKKYRPSVELAFFTTTAKKLRGPNALSYPMSLEDQLRISTLHEFGHLAGLRHEHVRKSALRDPNCKYLPQGLAKPGVEYGLPYFGPDYQTYGAYDSHSMMNYCFESMIKTKNQVADIHLSQGDRETLVHLYSAQ